MVEAKFPKFINDDHISASEGSRSKRFRRLVFPAPRKPVTIVTGKGGGGRFCSAVICGSKASETFSAVHCRAGESGFFPGILPESVAGLGEGGNFMV